MSETGICSHCKSSYDKCKYNGHCQSYCTATECQQTRKRQNDADWRQREREKLEEERLLEAAGRAEKLGLTTSKIPIEISSVRDDLEALSEVVENVKTSLSSLLTLLQGLAVKMTGDPLSAESRDFARSFLRECYDVGRSLFQASELNVNLKEILYEQVPYSAGTLPASSPEIRMGRSPTGP